MPTPVTAFFEDRIIARGDRAEVTRALEQGWPNDQAQVRVFDDATGRPVDLDLWDATPPRNGEGDRSPKASGGGGPAPTAPWRSRPRGRPRLGVIAREVTLLPRHWDWLAAQPGGASAALRRLVETARKQAPTPAQSRDAVYRFLTEMAGDRPNYEEAIRALYRGDEEAFRPAARRLAGGRARLC